MQLFYVPNITGKQVVLNEIESKHAIRVLRLPLGAVIRLVDGQGGLHEGKITHDNPKKCELEIIDSQLEYGKKNFKIHIAIAPTKNIDRFEWFLEKCTEFGIDEITPILSEHSERKVIKPERLQKILVSAMKQSVKAYLPKLNELTTFKAFIGQDTSARKYIAHCNDGEKEHLKNLVSEGNDVIILIGPEGDFSLEEVEWAKKYAFKETSLGTARLRTETAGVAACHIINLANE